eukprot:scaffold21847_cov73-Isochrysis_galbana.AAC.1
MWRQPHVRVPYERRSGRARRGRKRAPPPKPRQRGPQLREPPRVPQACGDGGGQRRRPATGTAQQHTPPPLGGSAPRRRGAQLAAPPALTPGERASRAAVHRFGRLAPLGPRGSVLPRTNAPTRAKTASPPPPRELHLGARPRSARRAWPLASAAARMRRAALLQTPPRG